MIKVYLPNVFDLPVVEVLFPFFNANFTNRLTGQKTKSLIQKNPCIELVKNIKQADYILIPHDYSYIFKTPKLDEYSQVINSATKPTIVFDCGDITHNITWPNTIILKNSVYKSQKKKNEIIIPCLCDDWGDEIQSVPKLNATLGFCGWGDYRSIRQQVGYELKALSIRTRNLNNPHREAQIPGIVWRKKVLCLNYSKYGIDTDFMIRMSFSGNKQTISTNPQQAKNDYRNTLENNTYQLSIRGDGNYSIRFFEILSAGRIPVLINTDCSLPLEDIINYHKMIIEIPYEQWTKTPQFISDHYAHQTKENVVENSKYVKKIFREYLRLDCFFEYLFKNEKIRKYQRSV